ncbi:MAG: NUDIX hydrolase [Lactobacillaceae bacterium]|jgi:ADP-ribose pyrophosphatase|nr:NUDIX hydrolase [Lactobacillaceae bacterium]
MKDVKILGSEIVYKGFNKITKYFFEFKSFDGKETFTMDKEIFQRKDAVAVLLYDPRVDGIVFIEQFRPGCYVADNIPCPLEIPAGLVDKGDDNFIATVKREAMEEANCEIEKYLEIGSFFPEISFSSRKIHLFCAKVNTGNLGISGGIKSESEDTKITLIKAADLRKMLDSGKIINSHTLIAVQWFFLNIDKVRKEFL